MMSNVFVSGKALAAGLLDSPAASASPLTTNREVSENINLSPDKHLQHGGVSKKRRVEMAGASSLRHLNPPSPKDTWKRPVEITPGRLVLVAFAMMLGGCSSPSVLAYRENLRFTDSYMFLAVPAGRNNRGCELLSDSGAGVIIGSSVVASSL